MLDRTLKPSDGCALGHHKNVSIVAWRMRADAAHVDAMAKFGEQLIPQYKVFSVIHVVEEAAGLPTSDGRDQFVAMRTRNKSALGVLAVLLPQSSVLATMLRAFVRGLRTILRGDLEVIVEQDLGRLTRELIRHHERRTGVKLEESELAAAIAETRRLLA